jgi:uncharacterized protein
MKVIVFGATGRVGESFVKKATEAKHDVTVFVRNAAKLKAESVKIYEGSATDEQAVCRAMRDGFDAVIVCLGERALKPSTIMTDSIRAIISAMEQCNINRLLCVSGTAEMPNKTRFGEIYAAILKRTPIGHAVRDHDGAFELIKGSKLNWTLAGCNYLKSGPERGSYKTSLKFPGGFKIIHPPDVADFLLRELSESKYNQCVVGLWY